MVCWSAVLAHQLSLLRFSTWSRLMNTDESSMSEKDIWYPKIWQRSLFKIYSIIKSKDFSRFPLKHKDFARMCKLCTQQEWKSDTKLTCGFIPCGAHTLKCFVASIWRTRGLWCIWWSNIPWPLGPWTTSTIESLVTEAIGVHTAISFTVLARWTELTWRFGRLACDIVERTWWTLKFGGKARPVWTEVALGTLFWGDRRPTAVFSCWKDQCALFMTWKIIFWCEPLLTHGSLHNRSGRFWCGKICFNCRKLKLRFMSMHYTSSFTSFSKCASQPWGPFDFNIGSKCFSVLVHNTSHHSAIRKTIHN